MKTNATQGDLYKALGKVNEKYNGNITFKGIENKGRQVQFTLTVRDSKAPGHRLGYVKPNGKQSRLAAACWHAHGDFFDALWDIKPDAVIHAGTLTMRSKTDNWQDRNIGSMMQPMYFSEACECNN